MHNVLGVRLGLVFYRGYLGCKEGEEEVIC